MKKSWDRRVRMRHLVAPAVAALCLLPLADRAVGSSPPKAHDYIATAGLSQPQYAIDKSSGRIPGKDGVGLYVEVTKPTAPGRWPVILEASPYHGTLADREGTRIFPGPRDADGDLIGLTGYFAPRGYAVVMVDLRGTGKSQGCLDHLGPNDAADIKLAIEWAASQPWSNGRVGMTGHSYVGASQNVAAATKPDGLVTIVPSAGLASMYDHQFQAGVPYFLQWVGTIEAYEELALERDLPGGEHFGEDVTGIGCGLPQSSASAGLDQLSGAYSGWHAERDYAAAATAAEIPVFLVHGVNDNAARPPGMDWFTARAEYFAGPGKPARPADKLWLGQWDHGSGCCPNRRGGQWTAALHAWFDKHLQQRNVDTGPPVEVFLADTQDFQDARTGDRDEVLQVATWPPAAETLTLHTESGGALGTEVPAAGSNFFFGDPFGAFTDATGGATFLTKPFGRDVVLNGVPDLTLAASVTVPRVHLIATLYDQDEVGRRRRITQFAINPELRHGIANPTPVVPGERMTLDPPGFPVAHHLRAGHRLALRVTTSDADKVPLFAVDPHVTVFSGPGQTTLHLPVLTGPDLRRDDLPGVEPYEDELT